MFAWVVPLKGTKRITMIDAFQKILDESGRKLNKIRVDNKSWKSWLQNNNIEMCSMCNEDKYFVSKRFIRTLENKIYEYMTLISKNMYIDQLGG